MQATPDCSATRGETGDVANIPDGGGTLDVVNVASARAAAEVWLEELPQQVHDSLESVTVQVVDQVPPGHPSNVKGIFLGRPQAGDPEDDDDCDAGEWYDYSPVTGELELAAHGGVLPAEGTIVLVAPNLSSPDDVWICLAHETGHALGLDEWEVAELGLE